MYKLLNKIRKIIKQMNEIFGRDRSLEKVPNKNLGNK
jgi:hypothetical protein